MGKHLSPLEKEFLIKRYLSNPKIKLNDFCIANDISNTAFKKWLDIYKMEGIELKLFLKAIILYVVLRRYF